VEDVVVDVYAEGLAAALRAAATQAQAELIEDTSDRQLPLEVGEVDGQAVADGRGS